MNAPLRDPWTVSGSFGIGSLTLATLAPFDLHLLVKSYAIGSWSWLLVCWTAPYCY